jgi:hypothetical protein
MIHTLFGIGLCIALIVGFVLFVRPRSGGCSGTGNCGACPKDGNCSLTESHHEQL